MRTDDHLDGEFLLTKTGPAALMIIAATDGTLWFTDSGASSVASIGPDEPASPST